MKKLTIVLFLVSTLFWVHHFLWGNYGFHYLLQGQFIPPALPAMPIEKALSIKHLTTNQELTAKIFFVASLLISFSSTAAFYVWFKQRKNFITQN